MLGTRDFGPRPGPIERGLGEILDGRCTHQRIEPAIDDARCLLRPGLGRRIFQPVGRRPCGPAIDGLRAVGGVDAEPCAFRTPQRGEQSRALFGIDLLDRLRCRHRVLGEPIDPLVAQLVAIGVEPHDADREDEDGQDVDRQDAVNERPVAPEGGRLALAHRGVGGELDGALCVHSSPYR